MYVRLFCKALPNSSSFESFWRSVSSLTDSSGQVSASVFLTPFKIVQPNVPKAWHRLGTDFVLTASRTRSAMAVSRSFETRIVHARPIPSWPFITFRQALSDRALTAMMMGVMNLSCSPTCEMHTANTSRVLVADVCPTEAGAPKTTAATNATRILRIVPRVEAIVVLPKDIGRLLRS